jgi:ribokinase
VDRLPGVAETVLATAFETFPGGKGANQAIAAARAGCRVSLFGCVGKDTFGDSLVSVLTGAGVDVSCLDRSATLTGTALISVDANGQNQISVFPGANAGLKFSASFGQASAGDVLLCQNECPLEIVLKYFQAAKRQKVTTILNAAPVLRLLPELLGLVDLLVVNEEEAAQYAAQMKPGHPDGGEADGLARRLRSRAEQIVIITLGDQGVIGLVEDRFIRLPGHDVDPVDTTGAGDCFCGYLASGLAGGKSIEEAMRLANAAAALAVQRKGAATAIPELAEVLMLLGGPKRMNHRGTESS